MIPDRFQELAEAFAGALCTDRWKGKRVRSSDEVRGDCPIEAHIETTPGAFGYNAAKDCYACTCSNGKGSALRATLDFNPGAGRDGTSRVRRPPPRPKTVYKDIDAVAADLAGRLGKPETGRWSYTNRIGAPHFAVLRFDGVEQAPDGKPQASKVYRPVHVVPGGWSVGDPPGPLPLYRLPDFVSAPVVQVHEGEKCCEAARSLGFIATTSAHGARSTKKSDWSTLAGKELILFGDKDKAGQEYIESVANITRGLQARVRVVELPGLQEGEDVADFIAKRKAAGKSLQEIRKEVETLLSFDVNALAPELVRLSDVTPKPVTFIRPGLWPRGKVVLISGDPDLAKSQIVTDAMSRISTGAKWPEGDVAAPMGSCILLAGEDDVADTILPRVMASGGDPSKIILLKAKRGRDGRLLPISLADIPTIEIALRQNPDTILVGVDPLMSFLGGRESNKGEQVRELLTPLADLASRHNLTVLVVNHLNKAPGGKAIYRSTGSLSFVAAARAAYLVVKDPQDPESRRLMLPLKCNLGPAPSGLAYKVGVVELPGLGEIPRLEWEADRVELSADEVLATEFDKPKKSAKERAAEWLMPLLANGSVLATEVMEKGKIEKIGKNAMYEAADDLKVLRGRLVFGGPVYWTLPSHTSQSSHSYQPSQSRDIGDEPAAGELR